MQTCQMLSFTILFSDFSFTFVYKLVTDRLVTLLLFVFLFISHLLFLVGACVEADREGCHYADLSPDAITDPITNLHMIIMSLKRMITEYS